MVTELTRTTDLAASATSLFVGEMAKAIAARGKFVVALSGGTTPLGLFANLARLPDLGWDRVKVFWGDERFVAHDDEASNFRSAREAFLERLPVDPANVYPWPQPAGSGDLRSELAGAAARYAEVLTSVLGDEPVFDLQLLGLGSDAHTASLYPSDPALGCTGLTAGATPRGVAHPRLTLTPRALSSSRCVAFLVSGEGKREALVGTLASPEPDPRYPARSVSALERLVWLTDIDVG